MRRSDVPTPALLVDIDLLDHNIAVMRDNTARLGVKLRPHAKAHKCVEIAQRLGAAGAVGASCATIAEAEAMALGGIPGVLLTAPLTSTDALDRLRRLLLRGADVSITVDNPASVKGFAVIARAAGRELAVIVDIDGGMARTGCRNNATAVALAKAIAAESTLRYDGIQMYWGHLQQVMPLTERSRLVDIKVESLQSLISSLKEANLAPGIVSGGGTGSHGLDSKSGLFTEMQAGSYLFMDSCYGTIDIEEGSNPFKPSLFVAASVVSANHPGLVTVNAGWKAFAADSGKPVAVRGAPATSTYHFMGDEHGAVEFAAGESPALGSTIEFLTSHCDPTVNNFDRYHVVRGEDVVDIWPIRGRY
ncbi:DSD1 family PLP-dependent enzyme [soil metagenome]